MKRFILMAIFALVFITTSAHAADKGMYVSGNLGLSIASAKWLPTRISVSVPVAPFANFRPGNSMPTGKRLANWVPERSTSVDTQAAAKPRPRLNFPMLASKNISAARPLTLNPASRLSWLTNKGLFCCSPSSKAPPTVSVSLAFPVTSTRSMV